MAQIQRSSDVAEIHGEHALEFGIGAVVALVLGGLMIYYQGMLMVLGFLLVAGGLAAAVYTGICISKAKSVVQHALTCPYCHGKNSFTEKPMSDVTCVECHRLIPIEDGRILRVSQVRCGFCNTLNYYSEKSVGLLCEECDREIPIAVTDPSRQNEAAHAFSYRSDDKHYDVQMISYAHKNEQQVLAYIQHLLALNRNQVKEMMTSLPCTLLVGVPRMKAELIQKDLARLDAAVDYSETRIAG